MRALPSIRRLRLALGAIILPLVAARCLMPPGSPPNVTYCSVSDPANSWHRAKDICTTYKHWPLWPPDHLVREGRLYLRVQTLWCTELFDALHQTPWDANKIESFRRSHQDLERYWPSAEEPGGGVSWAGAKSPAR
jgi:hypothetical protein